MNIIHLFTEWDPNWPGPEVIVEVSEGVTETQRGTIEINTTTGNDGESLCFNFPACFRLSYTSGIFSIQSLNERVQFVSYPIDCSWTN